MTLDRTIPQHVPADLVVDFNVYLPMRGDENYHDPYQRLQKQGVSEIFWSPYNGDHWVFARQDVLYEGFADYKLTRLAIFFHRAVHLKHQIGQPGL